MFVVNVGMIDSRNLLIKKNDKTNLNFEALAVRKAAQAKSPLFNQYLKENTSILKFLKEKTMSPSDVFKFLCHLTSNPKTKEKTAKELSSNPRKSENIKEFLVDKLGGAKKGLERFWTWFHDEEDGYRQAYGQYYENNIWKKSKNLLDLVKQSPNIAPWALRGKATILDTEVTLGELPEGFGDLKNFRSLIKYLKKWNVELHKNLNEEIASIKAQYVGNSMASLENVNKLVSSKTSPFVLDMGGKTFEIKPIIQSFSAKLIFMVDAISKDKSKLKESFVLKFPPHDIQRGDKERIKKFAENQAIRPDMPYLDAVVDFYLRENKSPNAPDIKFFDYKTQAVVYGKTVGEEPTIPEKYADNLYTFVNYNKVADLKKLGIELNDVHAGNFKVDEKGNYVLIDSGHVKYSNTFRPPIIGKHIILGNLCGRELCK